MVVATVALISSPGNRALAGRPYDRNEAAARAAAARRQQAIAAARNQLSAASAALSVAEAQAADARSRLNAAREGLEGSRKAIDAAQYEERNSSAAMRTIEANLMAVAGDDSEIGRARSALDAARARHVIEQQRVFNASPWREKLEEADKAANRTERIAQIRHDALTGDREYQRAQAALELAREKFFKLRLDLLKANKEWVAAADAAREANLDKTDALNSAAKQGVQKLPASQDLRAANIAIADAKAVIGAAEARLKAMHAPINKPKPKPKPKPTPTPTK